jgi:hypothetical protein
MWAARKGRLFFLHPPEPAKKRPEKEKRRVESSRHLAEILLHLPWLG